MPLTMADVRNAEPNGADWVLWDHPGFGVRIRPGGAKSFLVQYRTTSGQQRRVTLGKVGQLQLAEARREADRIIAAARLGQDPAARRTENRTSPTIRAAALEQWIDKAKIKDSTRAEYKRLLTADILPALGSTKLRALTHRQVRAFYHGIADSGRGVTANRCLAVLSALLQWCVERDLIDANPARGIHRTKKGVEKADTRTLSEAETGRFVRGCETLRAQGGYPGRMAVCFEIMLFCGLRPAEAMRLRWDQLDYDAGLIRFTSDNQKGGHDRPAYLRGPAAKLLKELERTDDEWVFPSRRMKGQPADDCRKIWARVEELAKFDAPAKMKHLRKTHLTLGRAWGHSLDLLSKSARHTSEAITAKHYVHTGDDRVRAAEDEIQERLASLANELAEVVEIAR